MTTNTVDATYQARPESGARWLRRVGLAGFTFFLIKGLLWLIAPVAIYLFS